jgi:hypothetical protein
MEGGEPDGSSPIEARVDRLLGVAAAYRTGIPLDDLARLLPPDAPGDVSGLANWFRDHPAAGVVRDGVAAPSVNAVPPTGERSARRARGAAYWTRAAALFDGPLSAVRRMTIASAVTGSSAYGEPVPGDDLDLLTVTPAGTVWAFLALTLATLRWNRRAAPPDGSHWCFNYVLDEPKARAEFLRRRDFLFAREALTARPVRGRRWYFDLLQDARWMERQLPRLYAARLADPPAPDAVIPSAGWPARLASVLVFPWLAAYLQARGVLQNHRLRRAGMPEAEFRTVTRWREFALKTLRYDQLTRWYAEPASRGE